MTIEQWSKDSFLQEARMALFSVDALMVQGALAPGETISVRVLAKLVFTVQTPAVAYLRCIRACAVLQQLSRIQVFYENGRVSAIASRDSLERPIFQLDAQMNLAFRRTPKQRSEDVKDALLALYGEE